MVFAARDCTVVGMISSAKIEAWGRFLAVSRAATAAIEHDLKRAGLPPIAAYEALLALARAGSEGMRPGELGAALLMPQYGLSRLVDRLERDGLAARAPFPGDARGQIVHPTDDGLEMLDRIWPVYRDAIADRFARQMSEEEARFLADLMGRFASEEAGVAP